MPSANERSVIMKLNYDCFRDILLYLENSSYNETVSFSSIKETLSEYDEETLSYTCIKLNEANMIDGHFVRYDGANMPIVHSITDITILGHEFLSEIHEDTVWNGVKSVANKIGATSVSALTQIASSVVTELIKAHFGII